jgi:hypothetical protein
LALLYIKFFSRKNFLGESARLMLLGMFVVSEAAAIRTVFYQGGELAAAVEPRRPFPGVTGNAEARECARTIAARKPLPVRRVRRLEVGKGAVERGRQRFGEVSGQGNASWRANATRSTAV